MSEVIQIILYLIGMVTAFTCFWFVDFSKLIRVEKREYAILVYFVVSIAIGFLFGRFFVVFGTLFQSLLTS